MKMLSFALLIFALSPVPAFADYSLVCGKVHDKGPEKSEVALVQNPETLDMKFFLNGKELPKERFIATGAPENKWYVTVYSEKNKDDVVSRFELREKPPEAQQFKPGQKQVKVGAARKCAFVDTTEKPVPPPAAQ